MGNKWITVEIFELIDQRRLLKCCDLNRYNEINKQIKVECRTSKKRWLKWEGADIDMLAARDTQLMYSRIADITRKIKGTTGKANKDNERRF